MNTSDNYDDWTLEQKTQTLEIAVNFITRASTQGNLSELQQLCSVVLERFDAVHGWDFQRLKKHPLEFAAEYGRTTCLQYLVTNNLFDGDGVDRALEKAASKGYWDCMQVLIPLANPKSIGAAMSTAAHQNHWTCVRHILPFVDPLDNKNFQLCLVWSSANKKAEFLAEFYARCNPEAALEYALEHDEGWQSRWSKDEMQMLVEYHSAEQQRKRLEKVVGETLTQSVRKSKM